MYTLILMVVLNTGPAMTSVEKATNLETCKAMGEQFVKELTKDKKVEARYTCLKNSR